MPQRLGAAATSFGMQPAVLVLTMTSELRLPTREAMEAFYTEHEERALRISSSMLRNDPAAVRDVVHESFLRAFVHLHKFRGESSAATWFSRVVINEAARYLRKQSSLCFLAASADEPADLPERDPALRRRITEAIEGLSGPQRDIFLAVHGSEISIRETAELIGKAPGTVRTHLQRALIRLRASLGDVANEILFELGTYSGNLDSDAPSPSAGTSWL